MKEYFHGFPSAFILLYELPLPLIQMWTRRHGKSKAFTPGPWQSDESFPAFWMPSGPFALQMRASFRSYMGPATLGLVCARRFGSAADADHVWGRGVVKASLAPRRHSWDLR